MLLLYFLGKTFFHLFWLFLLLQKKEEKAIQLDLIGA